MQSWMIGTAAGVFAVGWMPALPGPVVIVSALLLSAGLLRRGGAITALLFGIACGLAYGQWWGTELLSQRLPSSLEGELLTVEGRVMAAPQQRRFAAGRFRQRFVFDLSAIHCPQSPGECPQVLGRILLSYYGERDLLAGQRWRFTVRLKKPWGLSNPASFNYQSWLAQNGFSATGYAREQGAQWLANPHWWWQPHQQWRQAISTALDNGLPSHPATGVLRALSNGDRSGIDTQQWQLFQRYGLNHLVVISGLHVGMVAGIGFLVGGLFGRRSAHLAAAGLALLYAGLAGFALPTVRALVMLASVQLFALMQRRLQPLRCLSLALFAIALLDPLATHNAGFWLSFSAVGLIFYLRGNWPGLSKRYFLLFMQLSLSLAMGLLGSLWFGGSGWLSPLANLVAIPVLSIWIAPLCLLAALLAPLAEGGAVLAWQLAAIPIAGLVYLDELIAGSGIPLWISFRPSATAVVMGATGLLLLLAHRAIPLRWLALLCLCLPLAPPRDSLAPGSLIVTVMDVGQGLAVLVRSGDAVILYDTGAGDLKGPNMAGSVLLPYLQQLGIQRLDLLVISHNDRDHASGIYTLHQQLEIAQTWFGEEAAEGIPGQSPCRAGKHRVFGALRVTVLHPSLASPGTSANDSSCVIRVESLGFSVLLPGDISSGVEGKLLREQASSLPATVLIAAHHGSKTSSSLPFLRAVNPALAVFSTGYRNRFGHPHPDVLRRYDLLGITSLDTADAGAVFLQIEDGRLTDSWGWRHRHHYYWY
jgi:competence protein ComEC